MKMYLKIDDDVITDVKFETFGCGSAIASSSMATELIKGKPVSEAMKLTNKAVAEALDGLPAYKMHCSVLAEEAIQSALNDYYSKHPEKKPDSGKSVEKSEHQAARRKTVRLLGRKTARGNRRQRGEKHGQHGTLTGNEKREEGFLRQ